MKTDTAMAQTAQHTPGPWEVYGSDQSDIRPATKAGKNRIVAQCPGYKAERQANARLIASAPDLLKALLELEDSCFHVCGPCQPTQKAIDVARAAIAKATA